MLHHRRVARDPSGGATTARVRRGAGVRRTRSLERVLQLHAPLRPQRLLHEHRGRARGAPAWSGSAAAAVAAIVAPIVWHAPGQWPWWYTFLWIGSIGALALSRQTRFLVVNSAIVAALGAATLVWGRTARGRVEL